jgi:4-hydroxy-tetrahydrodipicolinate synthase
MDARPFRSVLPAITTPFDASDAVDHAALRAHARWLLDSGCAGLVPLGSLGEGAALSFDEKVAILRTLVGVAGPAPVLPGIGAAATSEAVALARKAAEAGCRGLMVLPPYVHRGPAGEAEAHVAAVFAATELPCMLYNNPQAYGTDFTPAQIEAMAARHDTLVAVKESSGDCRRVTAIRAACGDRIDVLVGLDDMVLEGVAAGAVGWVAGLVNALPRESVLLFERARAGDGSAEALYRSFLPLLRLDTVPEFVQAIKLVQQEVGHGDERVRPPRLPLDGPARLAVVSTLRRAQEQRPPLAQPPEVSS